MACGGGDLIIQNLDTGDDNACDMSEDVSNMYAPVSGDTVTKQQYDGLAGQLASYQLILAKFEKELKDEHARSRAEREDLLSEIEELKRERELGPFTVVKANKRVRSPVQLSAAPGLSTSNRYEPISNKRQKGQPEVDDYNTDEDEEIIEAARNRATTSDGSATQAAVVPKRTATTATVSGGTGPTAATSAAQNVKRHSPDFIIKNLPAPAFERAMREKNVKVMSKPLPRGEQKLICEFENRGVVLDWLKTNKVGGTTSTCKHERVGCAIAKGGGGSSYGT